MGKEEKSGVFSPLIVRWEKIKTDGTCVVELWLCKETGKSQVTNGVNLGNFSFKAAKQH